MEPKPGRLVRAIYDFPTDDASELPLIVGDIVQVKERIDKQWCRGCCNNIEGNFPIGFTIEVKIPELNDQQQLFGVTNDFIAQEDGDLTLKKGDLVVGNQQIDKNWWKGEIDGRHGIFPLTHVWKIDKSSLPATTKRKKMSLKAKVKLNMTAQIPDEMDLYKDEIVTIVEEVDKGWYRGECNGRQGTFPASFVTVLQDDNSHLLVANDLPNSNATYTNTEENDNQYGYDCLNSGITPYGRTIYPFKAEYANELSFNGGEIVNLVRHIDDNWIEGELDGKTGIFPANFINIIVDCPNDEKKPSSKDEPSNETDMDLFPVDTYGRVICDFYPQLEGDVRLREGDTVTLIRKIDRNWYEVVTDNGETGVCPESYIEVIGSGPPSYSEVMGLTFNGHSNSSVDSEFSLIDPGKSINTQPSKSAFTSSSDSSFSSQKSTCDNSFLMNSKDGIYGLDSSLFNSSENSFSSPGTKSSSFTSDSFSDRSSSFNNWLSPFPNTQENRNSFSDWESPVSLNAKNEVLSGTDQKSQLERKAPNRPPPPSNVPSLQVSSADSSSSSVNSARMSLTSVSSHGSSDDFTENWDQTQIRSQIQQKEQLLKQRIACKNKLESECKQSYNSYVSKELQKQVSDLNDDITHLKSEIEALQTNLKSQAPENINDRNSLHERNLREEEVQRKRELEQKRRDQERINKMKEQRECIITEMLQTERDYLSDLKLLYDTFMNNPTEAKDKGIDIMTIFGNLDEVIDVAGRLLRRLQKVSNDTQMIGECFVDMSDEMKEIYGHYCRNHDEVNAVLDKIDAQSPAGLYIKHKLEILKRQTNCFDLPSMLIKPVQRILKYPLLLNELLKCTQDGHPDKEWLIQAIKLMTDVAAAINEFKRKQDLIFKYRKQADTSLSGRISKINLHSMAKKSSRFGMRFYNSLGLKTMTKDQDFEKVERRFETLEKSLKIYQKDVCEYTKKVEDFVTTAFNMAEDIAELYQERKTQQEVDQFRSAHRIILTQFWEAYKQTIERSVNSPVKQLLQAYRGPINLIQKRYDKLLDYESSTNRLEKNKDVTKIKMLQDSQIMAKNNYEALNSQLLDDLPKLCDLSIEILYDCIRCFLKAKKNFIGRIAMQMVTLMDLPLLLGGQSTGILETFQVKHTLVLDDLCQLSIVPKQFQSCIKSDSLRRNSSPRGSKLSFGSSTPAVKIQNSSQKDKVKSLYAISQLYTACENFDGVDIMDISLKKGDVVGVIKQKDPLGSPLRWFVDNGEAKGFVPAKCLVEIFPGSSYSQDVGPVCNDLRLPSTSASNVPSTTVQQSIYSKPQKTTSQSQSQVKSNDVIQPTRPAPPVTASLRTVAPSRYPPSSQTVIPKPRQSTAFANVTNNSNISSNNVSAVGDNEPSHRYEEINDLFNNRTEHSKTCDTNLLDTSSASQSSSNILEEFDPYSSPKLPELYDNVPDNLNCLYSTHRYEDIPDEPSYDEVPNETKEKDSSEYYYAMYDFSPTGPNQLLLRKGQVVLVLHKCDLNSNTEWWFVEDRHGGKGYVPGAYLKKYSKDVV